MREDEEYYAKLTGMGWQMVEVCERMIQKGFSLTDISDAWNCQEEHILYMMARANEERRELMTNITGPEETP